MTDVVYGSTDPLSFKLTLDGEGVNATVVAGDFYISIDDAAGVALTNLPTAIDATNMAGCFTWTPDVTETSCKKIVININDASGTAFDENCLIWYTGGHKDAYHNG